MTAANNNKQYVIGNKVMTGPELPAAGSVLRSDGIMFYKNASSIVATEDVGLYVFDSVSDAWEHAISSTTVGGSINYTSVINALGYIPSNKAGDTFSGTINITGSDSATNTSGLSIHGPSPWIILDETDQTLPAGRWRMLLNGDTFRLQKNTAVAGDFSSYSEEMSISATTSTLDNNLTVNGTINGTGITASNGFTTTGATGLSFSTYGGSIYQTDTTWVRIGGNKSLVVESNSASTPAFQATLSNAANTSYAITGRPAHTGYGGVIGYSQNATYYGILGHANTYALYGNGTIYVTGNITAYSDIRAKKNVYNIPEALEKVNRLRGVEFDWKESGKHDLGFIAQEVQNIIPELVHETPDGKLGVNYQVVTAVLVEAIKTLTTKVQKLEEELLVLKDKQ